MLGWRVSLQYSDVTTCLVARSVQAVPGVMLEPRCLAFFWGLLHPFLHVLALPLLMLLPTCSLHQEALHIFTLQAYFLETGFCSTQNGHELCLFPPEAAC